MRETYILDLVIKPFPGRYENQTSKLSWTGSCSNFMKLMDSSEASRRNFWSDLDDRLTFFDDNVSSLLAGPDK